MKWIVYDTQEHSVNEFETYEEAIKEYERVKGEILVAGEMVDDNYSVYIMKVKKKASIVVDTDNEDDPQKYGFDYFVKWHDEDF